MPFESPQSQDRRRPPRVMLPSTFTLLLPIVNLAAQPISSAPVTTEGITTAHHFSVVPALQHGQQEFYSVTQLHGTGFNI